jgi:hypothetical protein
MIATFGAGFLLDGLGESQDMSEGIGMGRYDLDEVAVGHARRNLEPTRTPRQSTGRRTPRRTG